MTLAAGKVRPLLVVALLLCAALALGCAKKAVGGGAPQGGATGAPAVQYTCPMHPEVISDKPGKCPKCGMDLVEMRKAAPAAASAAPTQYTCSMHPEVISDKPGKCPKCGMDLIAKAPPPGATANEPARTWYCPIHPGKLYLKGERCEICGGELAQLKPGQAPPAKAHEGESHAGGD